MSEARLEWDFRELIENSDDIFIVVDRSFKIRYISSSVLKWYDTQPIALLGRNIFDYVSEDKAEEIKKCLAGPVSNQSYEIGLELKKGFKTYFDVHVSSVHQEDARGF